jgi:hypothetical protein
MDRWRIAPGDGDPDLAQSVAYDLQEYLVCALGEEQLDPLRQGTVTVHYYLRTDVDHDRDLACYQAVLYSPGVGWIAVDRPWRCSPRRARSTRSSRSGRRSGRAS